MFYELRLRFELLLFTIVMAAGLSSHDMATSPQSSKLDSIHAAVNRFFTLADDPTDEGSFGFSECFFPTGELLARGHNCKGRDG